jgi:hypothetical protein
MTCLLCRVVCAAPLISLAISPVFANPATGDVFVGRFSQGSLSGWNGRSFKGETRYELVRDSELDATVVSAHSDGAASGLYREITIDLTKTPYLNWSWKVTAIFPDIDEKTKIGDDFPARIYVVVRRGLLGTGSLALNYIWASRHPTGSDWPSPYTNQVRMVAADSGERRLGSWAHHKRDLRQDLKRIFGDEIKQIDAVAIMTDTDDHKGRAQTYYGDVWFSAE